MKILFLDFDGPLYSNRSIDAFGKIQPPEECRDNPVFCDYWLMDPVSVALMNELATSYDDLEVVLSTSWVKPEHTVEMYEELFKRNGLLFKIHKPAWHTPRFEMDFYTGLFNRPIFGRWTQIHQWLIQNRYNNDHWAIVDDPDSGGEILTCEHDVLFKSVMVDFEAGLRRRDIFRLRQILEGCQ